MLEAHYFLHARYPELPSSGALARPSLTKTGSPCLTAGVFRWRIRTKRFWLCQPADSNRGAGSAPIKFSLSAGVVRGDSNRGLSLFNALSNVVHKHHARPCCSHGRQKCDISGVSPAHPSWALHVVVVTDVWTPAWHHHSTFPISHGHCLRLHIRPPATE
jgi:hypothetical protein